MPRERPDKAAPVRAAGPGPSRYGPVLLLVAGLVGLRVLGVSMLLPVLSPYGFALTDSRFLVGLAFGGYGLTMAIMQVPMGSLSDRFGRRPLLLLGLTLFVVGNLVAGFAPSIEVLILGRLIEGAGAISAVALALATDTLPEGKRTLGLAIAGIAAGSSFLLGVAFGPLVASAIGVPGIFFAMAILGFLMMGVVVFLAPGGAPGATESRVPVRSTLKDPRGLSLDGGAFALYLTLTATLFALPLLWVGQPDGPDGPLSQGAYRNLLLIAVLVGGVVSLGLARQADKRGIVQAVAVGSFVVLGVGALGLLALPVEPTPLFVLGALAAFYFAAHGALSAALPSLVGKHFSAGSRGAAMGGLATAQYLGSFTGGIIGALLWSQELVLGVLVALVALGAAGSVSMLGKYKPAQD